MNDKEILDRLWEEYRETPFASFTLERKLNLTKSEYRDVLNLLGDMSDSGEVRSGYRIKRVASAMFKLIPQAQGDSDSAKGLPQAQGDSDSLKGLPLIDPKESLTGQSESDCLSTDEGNTGGKTKFNRTQSELPKTHHFDAACVAGSVNPPAHLSVLHIKAKGYGQRDLLPFSITKPGFNYGNRKRSSGDGCHKYDHVQLTKKDGTLHIGIINCFDHTPKANAPRKVRVECPNIDKKDPRVSGNTSQLTLIQRRDGYLYNQTHTFQREKKHESSNQEDGTAQLLLFSLS